MLHAARDSFRPADSLIDESYNIVLGRMVSLLDDYVRSRALLSVSS